MKARQGVRYQALEGLEVMDPETMRPVPRDGETIGEADDARQCGDEGLFENDEATKKPFPVAGSTPVIWCDA